jgi:predicted nucleic acid-binding protein
VARRCATLHVPDPRGERDALIAATALVHGLAVATRNVADFRATGVAIVNPWED